MPKVLDNPDNLYLAQKLIGLWRERGLSKEESRKKVLQELFLEEPTIELIEDIYRIRSKCLKSQR